MATIELTGLVPDPRIVRRHGERNLQQLEKSLTELGAARSIVVDETGTILAGNATVQAVGRAGLLQDRVIDMNGSVRVTVRRSNLTADQRARLALLDIRTAKLAEWVADILAALADEFDLSLLWNEDELSELLGRDPDLSETLTDPDEIPEPPDHEITKPCDLWTLCNHRLLCGDSTDSETLPALMAGDFASSMN